MFNLELCISRTCRVKSKVATGLFYPARSCLPVIYHLPFHCRCAAEMTAKMYTRIGDAMSAAIRPPTSPSKITPAPFIRIIEHATNAIESHRKKRFDPNVVET